MTEQLSAEHSLACKITYTQKHMLISWKQLVDGDCQPDIDVCQERLRFFP